MANSGACAWSRSLESPLTSISKLSIANGQMFSQSSLEGDCSRFVRVWVNSFSPLRMAAFNSEYGLRRIQLLRNRNDLSGAFGILIAIPGVIVMIYGIQELRDEAVQPAPTVNVEPLEPKVLTRTVTYETIGGFSSSQLAAP